MDTTATLLLVLVILLMQALVWVPVLALMLAQRNRIPDDLRRAGETLILGPERADYQGWTRRFGFARTMGTLALSDRRVVFKRPFGREISIPLDEIASVSDTATLGKLRHTGKSYLALTLRDGTEVVFWVRNQSRWLNALRPEAA